MKKPYEDDLNNALDVLKRGGVILYPTDTIWGIGCDATNPEAVRKVYEIKRRADSKALLVLVDTDAKVQQYVRKIPRQAWDLMELTTKPLTIIYENAVNLAPDLLAEDGSVGIRVTKEDFSRDLCYRFRKAITSTSANVSGEPSPETFREVNDEIKNAVDYVVKYRQNDKSRPKPSSIIKIWSDSTVKIIRK